MSFINGSVLMSDANNFSNRQQINPYYHVEPVDSDAAAREHSSLRRVLVEAGIKVNSVPSPANCQDGVYTANWALVRGDRAVLASLPNARHAEEAYAGKVLTDLGIQLVRVPNGLKFSGQGDALACGNLLFCGSGYRSDAAAQEFAADFLGYEFVQLHTLPHTDSNYKPVINRSTGWPDSYFYDIDLALAIIKAPNDQEKGLIAYCPEAFTEESCALLVNIDNVERIEISMDEAKHGFAANLISTGETVIMTGHAPKLASDLKQRGLKVMTLNITELAKGGGYIRCMTLTLD